MTTEIFESTGCSAREIRHRKCYETTKIYIAPGK